MHIMHEMKTNPNVEKILEIIVASERLIKGLEKIENVSELMLNDLTQLKEELVIVHNFSHKLICSRFPRLLCETDYDNFIREVAPTSNIITPYNSQKSVAIYTHEDNPSLIFYNVQQSITELRVAR